MSSSNDRLRGPVLEPERLTTVQRQLYDEIRATRRAGIARPNGPADKDGHLIGPFNAMLYVPAIGMPLQRLGLALRFGGTLDDVLRELVILRVAGHYRCEYERDAHRRIARELGVDDAVLEAIDRGTLEQVCPVVPESAAAAVELAQCLLDGRDVDGEVYGKVVTLLRESGMFEVNALVGYYSLLARQLSLFGAESRPEAAS